MEAALEEKNIIYFREPISITKDGYSLFPGSTTTVLIFEEFLRLSYDKQETTIKALKREYSEKCVFLFLIPEKHYGLERLNYQKSLNLVGAYYLDDFSEFLTRNFYHSNFKLVSSITVKGRLSEKPRVTLECSRVRASNSFIYAVGADVTTEKYKSFLSVKPVIDSPTFMVWFSEKLAAVLRRILTNKYFSEDQLRRSNGVGVFFRLLLLLNIKISNVYAILLWFRRTTEALVFLEKRVDCKLFKGELRLLLFHNPAIQFFNKSKESTPWFRNFLSTIGSGKELISYHRRVSYLASLTFPLGQRNRSTKLSSDSSKKKSLRILFVSGMFPSRNHAGGLRIYDLIRELNKLGHEVSLFSLEALENEKSCLEEIRPALSRMELKTYQEFNSLSFKQWIDSCRGNFDITHLEYPTSSILLEAGTEKLGKTIFTFMEATVKRIQIDLILESKEPFIANYFQDKNKKIRELIDMLYLETIACQKCDYFVSLTEDDARFIRDLYGVNSFIVPTGISEQAGNILGDLKEIEMSVGFFGNYNHYPNLDAVRWYLDHVHRHVLEVVPDYKFFVYGQGKLSTVKAQYNSVPGVDFVGRVASIPHAVLPVEVCIAPLISGAGFRGKINQYTFFSKPVVSTSIGASGLPYKHGDSILIEDDPELFAKSIILLLLDKRLGKTLGRRAKQICDQQFGWKRSLDLMESLYSLD